MAEKKPDKFRRWMIASFFLIPLLLFGSIGVYYAYEPVKMRVVVRFLAYDKTRNWAREEILDAGEKALPYLIGGFANKNERVRKECLSILAGPWEIIRDSRYKDFYVDKTIPQLAQALKSKNAKVRGSSAEAFSLLATRELGGRWGWSCIIEIHSNPPVELKVGAAQFLRFLRENSVMPQLVGLLCDPEEAVRESAVGAMEKITGESFGDFASAASNAQRQKIIQKWLDWWEENKEEYKIARERDP